MKINTLQKILNDMKQKGLDRAYLMMEWTPRYGPYPRRVRSPFGLVDWYPSSKEGMIIIYPTTKQIEKFLRKMA